jgi:hypothetical protein
MHRHVRNLYKRFLIVGRDYPGGLSTVREKAKAAFLANAGLDEERVLYAVATGRRVVQDLAGVTQLAKYRAMRKRYPGSEGGGA